MNTAKLISPAWRNTMTNKRHKGDLPRSWAWRRVKPGKCVTIVAPKNVEVK